jgi:hypothetical protein
MSFQKNKKNFGNHKDTSKQDMNKRLNFDFQPPTEEMENLTLGRTERRVPTTCTANASFPTWGQIKKLCNEGQNVVTCSGQSMTPEALFLAMLTLTSIQVITAENYTYWAYTPNPPLNTLITWWDPTVPVYANDSGWLPGAYDERATLKPEEEGLTLNVSYELGSEDLPVCIGNIRHCLKPNQQAWLSIIRNDTKKSKSRRLLILSGYSFEGNVINKTGFIGKPCTGSIADNMDDWNHWTDCIGTEVQQLLNTSYGSIIDQSPVGSA